LCKEPSAQGSLLIFTIQSGFLTVTVTVHCYQEAWYVEKSASQPRQKEFDLEDDLCVISALQISTNPENHDTHMKFCQLARLGNRNDNAIIMTYP
jgi:hypothetical protein